MSTPGSASSSSVAAVAAIACATTSFSTTADSRRACSVVAFARSARRRSRGTHSARSALACLRRRASSSRSADSASSSACARSASARCASASARAFAVSSSVGSAGGAYFGGCHVARALVAERLVEPVREAKRDRVEGFLPRTDEVVDRSEQVDLCDLRIATGERRPRGRVLGERLGELAERYEREARIDRERALGSGREPEVEWAVGCESHCPHHVRVHLERRFSRGTGVVVRDRGGCHRDSSVALTNGSTRATR